MSKCDPHLSSSVYGEIFQSKRLQTATDRQKLDWASGLSSNTLNPVSFTPFSQLLIPATLGLQIKTLQLSTSVRNDLAPVSSP